MASMFVGVAQKSRENICRKLPFPIAQEIAVAGGGTVKVVGKGTLEDFMKIVKSDFSKVKSGTGGVGKKTSGATDAIKVNNMNEFFETNFGKTLRDKLKKTNQRYDGQTIYEVTENIPPFKKGDKLYLDGLHKDHLEVFDKRGKIKDVLNLDGTQNIKKYNNAKGRNIKK